MGFLKTAMVIRDYDFFAVSGGDLIVDPWVRVDGNPRRCCSIRITGGGLVGGEDAARKELEVKVGEMFG